MSVEPVTPTRKMIKCEMLEAALVARRAVAIQEDCMARSKKTSVDRRGFLKGAAAGAAALVAKPQLAGAQEAAASKMPKIAASTARPPSPPKWRWRAKPAPVPPNPRV